MIIDEMRMNGFRYVNEKDMLDMHEKIRSQAQLIDEISRTVAGAHKKYQEADDKVRAADIRVAETYVILDKERHNSYKNEQNLLDKIKCLESERIILIKEKQNQSQSIKQLSTSNIELIHKINTYGIYAYPITIEEKREMDKCIYNISELLKNIN